MEEHPEKEPRENPKKKKITRLVIVTVLGGIFLPVIGYLADLYKANYMINHPNPDVPGHWAPVFTILSVIVDLLFIVIMCIIISSIREEIRKDDP